MNVYYRVTIFYDYNQIIVTIICLEQHQPTMYRDMEPEITSNTIKQLTPKVIVETKPTVNFFFFFFLVTNENENVVVNSNLK